MMEESRDKSIGYTRAWHETTFADLAFVALLILIIMSSNVPIIAVIIMWWKKYIYNEQRINDF